MTKQRKRPIGVFDSGLGGLTAVRALREVLPREDLVYLGDTGRVPYGTRSESTIRQYAAEDLAFLDRFEVKAVLVACGTVSSVALDAMEKRPGCPVYGVVDPAVQAALAATKSGRIGVLGTPASIRAGAYERKLRAGGAEVFPMACTLFVPLVEAGHIGRQDPILKLAAEEYLEPLRRERVDTLILGCTHYPLIAETIADLCPGVCLIDSGREAARALAATLPEREEQGEGACRFYVTDTVENFSRIGSMFLQSPIGDRVERVVL